MHSEYVICPVEVMLKDGSLDAGERCPREDPVVDDVVLPTDGMESLELFLLELLQTFDVSTILSLCFTSVQKNGESYIPEYRDFYSYVEAVIAEDLVQECSIDSMSLFVPVVKVSFARCDSAKVGKFLDNFYQLSVNVDADVWCIFSCLSNIGHFVVMITLNEQLVAGIARVLEHKT